MGTVTMERDGAVAVMTVSSPEVRNALTGDMGEQVTELCAQVDADPTVGALVVRGADGTFCSGADTRTWSSNEDPAGAEAYGRTSAVYGAFVRVGELRVPTVAAVRGAAVGAGLNLALATDLRVVADDARLIGGFVRAGITPGGGFFSLMARRAGPEAAVALGLFNQELSGARAAALGLAWEVVPDAEVEERAMMIAASAAGDPELVRRALAVARMELGAFGMPWPAAVEAERGTQMWAQRRRQLAQSER